MIDSAPMPVGTAVTLTGYASAPGLCPGDSGGPLFRTGTNRVARVNALISSLRGER